jgi:hypothetical protein
MGWPWAYEPHDLAGYIPDFICAFDAGDLLVEVKGVTALADLREHASKIEASGWSREALIVGARLWELDAAQPVCGIIGRAFEAPWGTEWAWSTARIFRCLSCGQHSILACEDSWTCRRCGATDGHVGHAELVGDLWGAAGSRVQWRAA